MNAVLHTTTVRRLIKADQTRLFAAFSKAEMIEQWFSPSADITVEVLQFDFTVGGRYRFRYAMPDGSFPTLGGGFELIKSPAKLAFTWVWEEPDPHANIPTRVSVELHVKGSATEIVLTHSQIPTEEIADRHAVGWKATFDHLEEVMSPGRVPQTTKRQQ